MFQVGSQVYRRSGGPDKSPIRAKQPLQLFVYCFHVGLILCGGDGHVHFWTDVVESPVEMDDVPPHMPCLSPIREAPQESKRGAFYGGVEGERLR